MLTQPFSPRLETKMKSKPASTRRETSSNALSATMPYLLILPFVVFCLPTISAEARRELPGVWNISSSISRKCPPSHVGNNCEVVNPCYTGGGPRCFNNGTCEIIWEKKRGSPVETVNFKCTCKLGYTNSLCETPRPDNACHNNRTNMNRSPCVNSSTCRLIDTVDQFVCDCRSGYAGRWCEWRDHCRNRPCRNNGTCTSNADSFSCQCAPGVTGKYCENDINECTAGMTPWSPPTGPCQNGAECINSFGSYVCQCKPGFTGKHCENIYVPCKPSPCQNGGECIVDNYLPSKSRCQCPPGFQGEFCEINIDDCVNNQCANGATCVDGINNYTCVCPPEFTGPRCTRDVDECAALGPPPRRLSLQCSGRGQCTNRYGGYSCMCDSGWEGKDCENNVDDCAFNSCMNGGTCIDYIGFYRCQCPPGKTGFSCHLDDPCVLDKPCRAPSRCQVNSVNGSYSCICERGFTGYNCDIDIDECAAEKEVGFRPLCEHGGMCVNTPGAYRCNCTSGYNGTRCERVCEKGFEGEKCEIDINECAAAAGGGENLCKNGGVCVDNRGYFTCKCPPGFEGRTCEHVKNECESEPCRNGGSCFSEVNGYKCSCPLGFNGTRCEENINDCAKMPCRYGNCIDLVNNFTCECHLGYTGRQCDIQIDECASKPCRNGGTCVDQLGRFTCVCPTGFTGPTCEEDVDECRQKFTVSDGFSSTHTKLGPCKRGTCRNLIGSYECDCAGTGYAGRDCDIDIDACRATQSRCANGGTCLGWNRCLCPPGYSGLLCEHQINECVELATVQADGSSAGPCQHGGKCEDLPGGYQCVCPTGWSGHNCTVDIDDCAAPDAACHNGGKCIDLLGDYQCDCPAGTLGKHCEVNVDDCYPGACFNGGTCVDEVNGFDCSCPNGFVGPRCEGRVDACLESSCSRDGTLSCEQLQPGHYQCRCLPGHTGRFCETKFDSCDPPPCYNGGRCELLSAGNTNNASFSQGFVCRCPLGFRGALCEQKFDPCSVAGNDNVVEACRNGGVCFASEKTAHGYDCMCDPGYAGMHCQEKLYGPNAPPSDMSPSSTNISVGIVAKTPTPFDFDPDHVQFTCPYKDCIDKVHDGHCDQQCNSRDCAYDGGDCSLGVPNPWLNCLQKTSFPCWQYFDNGICDEQCNSRECLYDGYDCVMHRIRPSNENGTLGPKCPFETFCAQRYGDGHCDIACNSEACGYDGLDCDTQTPPELLDNGITVFLNVSEALFRNYSQQFLQSLSTNLRSNVRIRRQSANGEQMIRTSCMSDMLNPVSAEKSTCDANSRGTMVVLDIDNRRCKDGCFESAESVSQYLAALSSKPGKLQVGVPMKLVRPYDGRFDSTSSHGSSPNSLGLGFSIIVGIIVISLLLVGMLHARQQHKKRIRATTWFPADFPGSMRNGGGGLGTHVGAGNSKNSGTYSTTHAHGTAMRQRQNFHQGGSAHVISPLSIQAGANGEFGRNGDELKVMRTCLNPMMDSLYAEPTAAVGRREVSGYTESSTCDSIATTTSSSAAYAAGRRDEYELQPPAAKRRRRAANDEIMSNNNNNPADRQHYDDHSDEDDDDFDNNDEDGTLRRRRRTRAEQSAGGGAAGFTPPMNEIGGLLSPPQHISPQTAQLIHTIQSAEPAYRNPAVEYIFQLIQAGADLHYKFEMCETLLHEAARRGKINVVRALMHYGCDPNAADKLGNTPLHVAIESDQRHVVQFMLSYDNTDVNARSYDMGATPLIMTSKSAGQTDLLALLLQRGAKHDLCDNNGRSPLHWAAAVNNCEAIDLLCEHDAKIDMQNEDEATPLFLAAKEGNVDAVKMLLKKNANANQSDNMEQTPYDIALARKHLEVLDVLEAHKSTQFIGNEGVYYSHPKQQQQINSLSVRRNQQHVLQPTNKLSTEASKFAAAMAYFTKPNSAQQQNVRILQQQQQQQQQARINNVNTLPCRGVAAVKPPSSMMMLVQRETFAQAAAPALPTPTAVPTTPSSAANKVPFMFFGQNQYSQPQQQQSQPQSSNTGKRTRSDGPPFAPSQQQQQLISPPLPSPRVQQQPPMSATGPSVQQPMSAGMQQQIPTANQHQTEFTWDCSPSSLNSNGQNANGSTPIPPCGISQQPQMQQHQHSNQQYYTTTSSQQPATAPPSYFPQSSNHNNNAISPPQYAPVVTSPLATSSSSSGRGSSIAQPLSVLNKSTPPITSPLLMSTTNTQQQQNLQSNADFQPNNNRYSDDLYASILDSNVYDTAFLGAGQQQQSSQDQFSFASQQQSVSYYSYPNTHGGQQQQHQTTFSSSQQHDSNTMPSSAKNAAAQAMADRFAAVSANISNKAYYTTMQDYPTPSPDSPLKMNLWTTSFSPSSNDDHSPLAAVSYNQQQQQQIYTARNNTANTPPSNNTNTGGGAPPNVGVHQMLPSFAHIKAANGGGPNASGTVTKASYVHHGAPQPYTSNY